jgi:RecA-family ATPase
MVARGCDRSSAFDWLSERVMPNTGPEIDFDRIIHTEAPSSASGDTSDDDTIAKEEPKKRPLPPLTIDQWEARTDVESPDFLMGELLSTTTRMLLVAATGLGKTQVAMALAIHIAAGKDFLHWKRGRPARVLYIDGEMSKRQFRRRILDLARRFTGPRPNTLFFLCREDVPDLAPLNTPKGQKMVEGYIEQIGGVDLIIFDSIMCLTQGDLKETDAWRHTLPWVQKLTKQSIGQIWIHHTGHDETRSYGDKTKEWQLDVVAFMTGDGDRFVDFKLEFKKARERSDDNYRDFAPHQIKLERDEWTSKPAKPSKDKEERPKSQKDRAFGVLAKLMGTKSVVLAQSPTGHAVSRMDWQNVVVEAETICSVAAFRNHKSSLKSEGKIGEFADFVWIALPKAR